MTPEVAAMTKRKRKTPSRNSLWLYCYHSVTPACVLKRVVRGYTKAKREKPLGRHMINQTIFTFNTTIDVIKVCLLVYYIRTVTGVC